MHLSPPSATTVAGALTTGAGLAHVAAAVSHAGHDTAVALFLVVAVVQVALGAVLLLRPGRAGLLAAAAVNALSVAAWAISRTAGLPLVEDLAQREPVGIADVTVVVAQGAAVAAALLAARAIAGPHRLSPVLALAVVPALVGMAAPATHVDDHHATGVELASSHPHPGEGEGGAVPHGHAAASGLAADPVFSGLDTADASAAELQAAKRLIETTRAAVAARFPDQASLLAAGYRSIGDGLLTPFDHFIKAEYLSDGKELDPTRVESVVMERTATGWRVASAMYILEIDKTMADVPEVAGDLAAWHDHQNLCWDRSGTRLAGMYVNGKCFPGGTFRATPPMLHVWLQNHPCGPFAGIEGHGGGCAHGH